MQLLLRDLGFNPGPVDGIAGAKTKSAVDRFQAGCSIAGDVIEQWAGSASRAAAGDVRAPNLQETRMIQAQLKNAGFNPGPIDGIFGSKTRSLLAQLKNGCPLVAEFVQGLDQAVRSPDAEQGPQSSAGRFLVSRVSPSSAAAKQSGSPLPRSQEEVRILQLQLKDAGFDPGPFDGIMGPRTRTALEQYQASRKGKATAVVSRFGGQY